PFRQAARITAYVFAPPSTARSAGLSTSQSLAWCAGFFSLAFHSLTVGVCSVAPLAPAYSPARLAPSQASLISTAGGTAQLRPSCCGCSTITSVSDHCVPSKSEGRSKKTESSCPLNARATAHPPDLRE